MGALLLISGQAGAAEDPGAPTPSVQETVVVSATRGDELETEIPGQATVITGEELRRENVKTLADALQNVVGLDTGGGSDNGSRLPNIGLWGLKEFDALLVMIDGVPAGGPFSPSLSQINVEDIERIEIVKGPQGTLYGVSAFAGMIQIFTRHADEATDIGISGGSFSEGRLSASTRVPAGPGKLRLFGTFARSKGWQDRTDHRGDRGGLRWDALVGGKGNLSVVFEASRDTQFFGSPTPVDAGRIVPGFRIDRNYEVGGARLDHRIYALTTNYSRAIGSALRLENTASLIRDDQTSIRSFLNGIGGNDATAAGVALRPRENDFYDDLHLVAQFEAAGHHRVVGGAALTWGRTTARGRGFDIDLQIDPVIVPDYADTPTGDNRSFVDRRTFVGFYVNDEWTPVKFFTVTAGARYDRVAEALFAKGQEAGAPEADVSRESRSDGQWSGGLSGLFRAIGDRPGPVNEINLYLAAKSAFKPAAPNLSEAESAKILDPERTRSGEIGLKTRWLDRQLSVDISAFHMIFENLVVSAAGSSGAPELLNAGKERFQGVEIETGFRPAALENVVVSGGYAHHDARFVRFSFFTPEGDLRVVDGKRLELSPRDLWNLRAAWQPELGFAAWAAIRHQNHRPLNRRNTFYTPSYEEWDAGVGWGFTPKIRLSVVGRNLGDSRHFVSESEIGDSQFYVAPPKRFLAELTARF
jgi:outer membrane receptor protein involved in Fe transport